MEAARQIGMRLVSTTDVVNREGMIAGVGYGPLDLAGPKSKQFLETGEIAAGASCPLPYANSFCSYAVGVHRGMRVRSFELTVSTS